MPSLLELLSTGGFGTAAPGASEEDVLSELGEPDFRSPQGRRRRTWIWKWDALEVCFYQRLVTLIHTEFEHELQPAFLDSHGWTRNTTQREIEQALDEAGVRYAPDERHFLEGEEHSIVTTAGAVVGFDWPGTLLYISSK